MHRPVVRDRDGPAYREESKSGVDHDQNCTDFPCPLCEPTEAFVRAAREHARAVVLVVVQLGTGDKDLRVVVGHGDFGFIELDEDDGASGNPPTLKHPHILNVK